MFTRKATPPNPPPPHEGTIDRLANKTIIANRYLLERTIGKGSYGKVKLATDLADPSRQVRRALKFIPIDSLKKSAHLTRLRRETALLHCLHHPHVIKLYDHFQTADDLVLVLEYVNGQDLFDRITRHPSQRLDEAEARQIFRQLVSALDYCHRHNVIHRDLKPENVMITGDGMVKLIDFGFANLFDPLGALETNCGSPLYASPEIVRNIAYRGPEVDCWSLGAVLFAMLTGTLPFEDDSMKILYEKICKGVFSIPAYVSTDAVDLLTRMLKTDPARRASMNEIKSHKWTCDGYGHPPDSHMPYHPAEGLEIRESIVASIASDLKLDIDRLHFDILSRSESPAHSLYWLYCEQVDRERRSIRSPLYTMVDLSAALDRERGWVAINPITVNDSAKPLLHYDFDSLSSRLSFNKPAKIHQKAPDPRQPKRRIVDESGDFVSPQPSPHANFLQQAVGHLNNQFRKIKNIIQGSGSSI